MFILGCKSVVDSYQLYSTQSLSIGRLSTGAKPVTSPPMAAFIPNFSCAQPSPFISSPPPSSTYSPVAPIPLHDASCSISLRVRVHPTIFAHELELPQNISISSSSKKRGKKSGSTLPHASTSTRSASAFQSRKSNGSIIASCAHPFALLLRPALFPDAALWCDGLTIVRTRLHP